MNAVMHFSEATIKGCKLSELAKENLGKTLDYKELDKPIFTGINLKSDDNGSAYQQINEKTGEKELKHNFEYELNGYKYKTDDEARIISAEGKVKITDRENRQSINTDLRDKKETDDKGHLIGDRFDGDNGLGNLVPMDANLNRGDFKKLENEFANSARDGKDVYVTVEPKYEGDSKRPDSFAVAYTIDGEMFEKVFENKAKEK